MSSGRLSINFFLSFFFVLRGSSTQVGHSKIVNSKVMGLGRTGRDWRYCFMAWLNCSVVELLRALYPIYAFLFHFGGRFPMVEEHGKDTGLSASLLCLGFSFFSNSTHQCARRWAE